MKNTLNDKFRGGECVMAVNDMVEVISTSNPEIYGVVGTVKDIKTGSEGTELRIETKDGLEFWIDAEDVVVY